MKQAIPLLLLLILLTASTCGQETSRHSVQYIVTPQNNPFVKTDPTFRIFNYAEWLARVRIQHNRYQYIDRKGQLAFAQHFTAAADFHHGLARVQINGKYGYINHDGHLIIPAVYQRGYNFSANRTLVEKDGRRMIIDRHGRLVFKLPHKLSDQLTVDIQLIHQRRSYGTTTDAVLYRDGLLKVVDLQTGKIGFLDTLGRLTIPLRYDWATPFRDGRAMVRLDTNRQEKDANRSAEKSTAYYAVIDTDGTTCFRFCGNLHPVVEDFDAYRKYIPFYKTIPPNGMKVYGIMNTQGEAIVAAQYEQPLLPLGDQVMLLGRNDSLLLFDLKGKIRHRIPLKTDSTTIVDRKPGFSEGLLAVKVQTDKGLSWGYMDEEGHFIVRPQFAYAENFHEGRAVVFPTDEQQGIIKNPLK